MKEITVDSEADGTPRAAVRFLGMAALAVIPTLKNPGRRVGAKLEIEKAVRQLEEELTRLYGIERTARLVLPPKADALAHGERPGAELCEAIEALEEALGMAEPPQEPRP
mgnify:CR=1 FL=1